MDQEVPPSPLNKKGVLSAAAGGGGSKKFNNKLNNYFLLQNREYSPKKHPQFNPLGYGKTMSPPKRGYTPLAPTLEPTTSLRWFSARQFTMTDSWSCQLSPFPRTPPPLLVGSIDPLPSKVKTRMPLWPSSLRTAPMGRASAGMVQACTTRLPSEMPPEQSLAASQATAPTATHKKSL